MSAADREKWDAKYAAPDNAPRQPSAVLLGLAEYLPTHGRALDIAGGAGRHSLWLARRGLNVTLADISPVGLALARQRAADAGVEIQTLAIDLERERLPPGPFDLVASLCYHCPHLFPQFPAILATGGTLIVIQPTKKNLERYDKPPADYLFEENELRTLAGNLQIIHYREGWSADNRHDAILVARKQ